VTVKIGLERINIQKEITVEALLNSGVISSTVHTGVKVCRMDSEWSELVE